MAKLTDSTVFYRHCYTTAKKKGLNSLEELILYLENNPKISIKVPLDRETALMIAKNARDTYVNDVRIQQAMNK